MRTLEDKKNALRNWVHQYGYSSFNAYTFDPFSRNGKEMLDWLKMLYGITYAEVNNYEHHKSISFFIDGNLYLEEQVYPPKAHNGGTFEGSYLASLKRHAYRRNH